MKKLFTVFALVFSAVAAMAQFPAFMNYSCSIKGSDGVALADTKVSVKVTLTIEYTKYVETHGVMTDANGLANIIIGKGTATAQSEVSSLDMLPWEAQNIAGKLKVEIDPDGGSNYTISGESEIGSVPFSYRSNYADIANRAKQVGDMPMAVVEVSVEGANIEIEFLGRRLTSANVAETFIVPAYSPIYYSVKANGKYYTVSLNGECLKNEKMTYKKTEGVVVNALGTDDYNWAVKEMGITPVTGFSANTMIAGKPMLYSKDGKTLVSESATESPAGSTADFNAYSSKIPVNGFSFMEYDVDRGEVIGRTDVNNKLVGPFKTDITNKIVVKHSATVPPLY